MSTILVTGTTGGLGLEIVKHLARRKDHRIYMAVRDLKKGKEIEKKLGGKATAVLLDLSKLRDVKQFAENWDIPLDGLINNAGVQFTGSNSFTQDGFEETIAVNHLASYLLTRLLAPKLSGGRVLFIGSGTHNPQHPQAKMFGFRGARYSSVRQLAAGEGEGDSIKQLNLDRYATSKFLNLVTVVELARRFKDFSSYALDPGLMPGTGLARTQTGMMRFLWHHVMPFAGIFMADTTKPRRSGKSAGWIVSDQAMPFPSGTILSYNRRPYGYVWKEMVFDERVGQEVFQDSEDLLSEYLGHRF